jgi:hypothetical protein
VPAVQAFLDGSTNVTQDGSTPPPVNLPVEFDADGALVIGSDVDSWAGGWSVGLEQ